MNAHLNGLIEWNVFLPQETWQEWAFSVLKKMLDKTKDCWSWAKREKPRWGLCKFTICNFIFFRNCMWSIDEFNQIFFHRYSMSKLHSKHWKLNSEQIFAKTLWIFYMDGLEFDPYWIDRLWNNICCHETNLCHANVEWRIYCWWAAEHVYFLFWQNWWQNGRTLWSQW